MSLRSPWEPQSGLSLTRPGIAQGQCKPQNPGNGLNVKVPRHSHRQGHGLPKGAQAHLLGPGGLWVPPPPALPRGGLRLPMVVLGQGSRVQPASNSLLTVSEAWPGTAGSPLSRDSHSDPEAARVSSWSALLSGIQVACGSAGTQAL